MISVRLRILVLLVPVCLLPAPLIAQNLQGAVPGFGLDALDMNRVSQNHWIIGGKVTTLRGDPVRGAKVEVQPLSAAGQYRILVTNFQGEFQTEYWLNTEFVKEFDVTLTVTKKGFLKAQETIDLDDSSRVWMIPVTLREPEEDPRLLSQADLISRIAPRLKKLGASEGLSAAAEKDYARGVEEFLDRHRPDLALPPFTKVTRHDPSCIQCSTMLALAQLDSGDWDGATRNLGQAINKIITDSSVGRSEPLLVFGVMQSWCHEPAKATGYFVEALKYAPKDPLGLQEVGRAQLLLQNWGAADQYLSNAMAAGAGADARLLRIEALLGGDQVQTANTEMTRYLGGRDVKKMPFQVRRLWVQIQERMKVEAAFAKAKPKGDASIDYLHHLPPDLKGLEPASDQRQLDSILSAVGKTVAEFFRNFPNTTSLEQVHQEKLSHNYKAIETLDQQFQYVCFTPAWAWGPGFDEYRADSVGIRAVRQSPTEGFMLTSGFAAASLLFHPTYQSQAAFRYVGRQKVNGRDTYVVAFAQLAAKSRLYGSFRAGDTSMTTLSQGLAWVDSESYEITRLRTDLLTPLPEFKLERETTEIAFGPVYFNSIGKGFLVPRQVSVTVDWNGKHLRNEHTYSDFKLFNVEAFDKPGKPSELGQTSNRASDPQTPP